MKSRMNKKVRKEETYVQFGCLLMFMGQCPHV